MMIAQRKRWLGMLRTATARARAVEPEAVERWARAGAQVARAVAWVTVTVVVVVVGVDAVSALGAMERVVSGLASQLQVGG
jgi:hypothetical protein